MSPSGRFLEEDAYEDWAIALRERPAPRSGGALAAHARATGRVDDAVRYLLRLLEHAAYDERAHLDLVAALVKAGRHGEARRCYLRYERAMGELGVEPAPFPDRNVKAT